MSGREMRGRKVEWKERYLRFQRLKKLPLFIDAYVFIRHLSLFFDKGGVEVSSPINRGTLPDWNNCFIARLPE